MAPEQIPAAIRPRECAMTLAFGAQIRNLVLRHFMQRLSSFLRFLPRLWPVAFLVLGGCFDQSSKEPDPEILHRLNQLQTEIDVLKTQQSGQTPILQDRLSDMQRRVEELEAAGGQNMEDYGGRLDVQDRKLTTFQQKLTLVSDAVQTGQPWSVINVGKTGHAVARTLYGSFLVELESHDKEAAGYLLRMRIANPNGIRVHQFKISGEFGEPPPLEKDYPNAAAYQTEVDRWAPTLKPFEKEFLTELPAGEWTAFNVFVPANKLSELRFIRFRLDVQRVALEVKALEDAYTRFTLDQTKLIYFHTEEGSFPTRVGEVHVSEKYTELDLVVGNPLGLSITKAKLTGFHGPKPPSRSESADSEEYARQLMIWNNALTPFEAEFTAPITAMKWNFTTVRFKTLKREDLAYIKCTMGVLQFSLPEPR